MEIIGDIADLNHLCHVSNIVSCSVHVNPPGHAPALHPHVQAALETGRSGSLVAPVIMTGLPRNGTGHRDFLLLLLLARRPLGSAAQVLKTAPADGARTRAFRRVLRSREDQSADSRVAVGGAPEIAAPRLRNLRRPLFPDRSGSSQTARPQKRSMRSLRWLAWSSLLSRRRSARRRLRPVSAR